MGRDEIPVGWKRGWVQIILFKTLGCMIGNPACDKPCLLMRTAFFECFAVCFLVNRVYFFFRGVERGGRREFFRWQGDSVGCTSFASAGERYGVPVDSQIVPNLMAFY